MPNKVGQAIVNTAKTDAQLLSKLTLSGVWLVVQYAHDSKTDVFLQFELGIEHRCKAKLVFVLKCGFTGYRRATCLVQCLNNYDH